jgi:hypothetical protein
MTSDVEKDEDKNPYNTLPDYFEDLVALLDFDFRGYVPRAIPN